MRIHTAYSTISFILRISSQCISYIMTLHTTNSLPFLGKIKSTNTVDYVRDSVVLSKIYVWWNTISAFFPERCSQKTFSGSVRSTLKSLWFLFQLKIFQDLLSGSVESTLRFFWFLFQWKLIKDLLWFSQIAIKISLIPIPVKDWPKNFVWFSWIDPKILLISVPVKVN